MMNGMQSHGAVRLLRILAVAAEPAGALCKSRKTLKAE
jgi:hypothetical protein